MVLRPEGAQKGMGYLFECMRHEGIDISGLPKSWVRNEKHFALAADEMSWLYSCLLALQEDPNIGWSQLSYIKDEKLRYAFVSTQAANLFGLSPLEMLGHTDEELPLGATLINELTSGDKEILRLIQNRKED